MKERAEVVSSMGLLRALMVLLSLTMLLHHAPSFIRSSYRTLLPYNCFTINSELVDSPLTTISSWYELGGRPLFYDPCASRLDPEWAEQLGIDDFMAATSWTTTFEKIKVSLAPMAVSTNTLVAEMFRWVGSIPFDPIVVAWLLSFVGATVLAAMLLARKQADSCASCTCCHAGSSLSSRTHYIVSHMWQVCQTRPHKTGRWIKGVKIVHTLINCKEDIEHNNVVCICDYACRTCDSVHDASGSTAEWVAPMFGFT